MTVTTYPKISLEDFLKLPETKPASEYINGEIIQKTMPKGRHSRLQTKLVSAINRVGEAEKLSYAFTELRCTFGTRSIVPDIAVFTWNRIPFTNLGEVPDDFNLHPDLTIEILSPEQKTNKVIGNILHCLNFGSKLGWLIDPEDRSVLVFQTDRQPQLFQGKETLLMLAEIPLQVTVEEIFGWLKMEERSISE
jgi:Uma2 family endonuclease